MRLVAGPSEVYICHLCVALCSEILAQDSPAPAPGSLTRTELTSQKPAGRPSPAS